MMLSKRLQHTNPSATLAIAAEAAKLKGQGHNVISLALGEPAGVPPTWVTSKVIESLNQPATHRYTPVNGLPSLRKAIAEDTKLVYGIQYNPQNVLVGVGAKQIIFHAMMATLNPGDEVIIPAPYWVSYPEIVSLMEAKSVYINWHLNPEELEKAITPKTRWLIINSPCNPTGVVLSKNQIESILPILEKYPHVSILCDDIYHELVYDDAKFHSIAAIAPASWKDRFLIVNGVSKTFAMTGWRIGYGCGPSWLIEGMELIQSQSSSNPTTVSQIAAEAAICGPKDFLHEWRASYQKKRDICKSVLDKINLPYSGGQGAFYLLVDCASWIGKTTPQGELIESDIDVANFLLNNYYVVVVPGSAFGAPNCIRISYVTDDAQLREAMQRFEKAYQACQ